MSSLQYGELRPTSAEIVSLVWGTPANFNGFRVLAALLNGTLVVSVSQTLRFLRGWTGGATYIRQSGHHVGHWPTFLVIVTSSISAACIWNNEGAVGCFWSLFRPIYLFETRIWANAQRDGRSAKYRWRPLFNAAVSLTPILECRAVTLPRRETRWN